MTEVLWWNDPLRGFFYFHWLERNGSDLDVYMTNNLYFVYISQCLIPTLCNAFFLGK